MTISMNFKSMILSAALGIFVTCSAVHASDPATLEQAGTFGAGLSVGTRHVFSLDFNGVTLDSDAGWPCNMRPPPLKNPRQVSIGELSTYCPSACALDDDGVSCWRGDWGYGAAGPTRLPVPDLKNPRQISVAGDHACALDDDGVQCWGEDQEDYALKVPALKKPRYVSAGGKDVCALDDDGVQCWGLYLHKPEKIPSLRNPRQISVGGYGIACALDDEGVKCWGQAQEIKNVPPLRRPKQVSVGHRYACALDEDGVKCWGAWEEIEESDRAAILIPPPLKIPSFISAGRDLSCAIDAEGIKCWGLTEIPTRKIDSFQNNLASLEFSLIHLGKASYIYRRDFYQKVRRIFHKHQHLKARIFLANAITPVIENTETEFFQTSIVPTYAKAMEGWKKQFSFASITDIELTPEVYGVGLSLIQSSLEASQSYVNGNQRDELEGCIVALGRLSARPADEGSRALNALLQQHDSLVQSLVAEPRTKAFGMMISLIAGYFASKT